MEDAAALSFRLESYLMQLADINRRWSEWLSGTETAVVSQDMRQLQSLEPQASQLMQELGQVMQDRARLLQDAEQSGWPSQDLTSLAQRLPAWEKASLRGSLAAARQQLANLRRLHVATWVLISQALHFCNSSMQLMSAGIAQPHVYLADGRSDIQGGRLLDTDL